MTATWEIETQIIPQFLNENKGRFFEDLYSDGTDFFCRIFNSAFRVFYDDGKLKSTIQYEPYEFYITAKLINETDRIIYIELPEPRKSDFSYDMYVKAYFIPYRIKENGIEIFDAFGIDAIKDMDTGLIIWYKDSQHMISNLKLPVSVNDRDGLILFMSEYIFDRI